MSNSYEIPLVLAGFAGLAWYVHRVENNAQNALSITMSDVGNRLYNLEQQLKTPQLKK